MPAWVSAEALKVVLHYLKTNELDCTIDYTNQTLIQRLLWLTDFLQIDELQSLLLCERIIPSLNAQNCLLFLSESFKKLKIAEDSSELWYKLFNKSIESLAKHLVWNIENKKAELLETNDKILEEVIERALKFASYMGDTNQQSIINLFLETQNLKDPLECLAQQHEKIIAKKFLSKLNLFQTMLISDNSDTESPNISWKLKNLSQITTKETAIFKFGGFSWKLIAKPKTVSKTNETKILELYLKYESPTDVVTLNETDGFSKLFPGYKKSGTIRSTHKSKEGNFEELDSYPRSGFLSVSYNIKVNGELVKQQTTIRSCLIQNSPFILLSSLRLEEGSFLNEKESEFTIFLNLEFVYSSLLLHIFNNMETFTKNGKIGLIRGNDLSVILRNIGPNVQPWRTGIELVLLWSKSHHHWNNK